jgi:exodeoxyribonuclease V alpha subunit
VRSYRYDPSSSIASLARAVREGDVESAFLALNSGHQDVTWLCPKPSTAARGAQSAVAEIAELEQTLRDGYAPFISAQGPEAKLAALAKFRILSPHRQGRLGVTGLNALAERVLCTELNAGHLHHYPGRPIMVTANDYQMDLFNGDIGVIEFSADGTGLAAYFEGSEGLRAIHPSRLPAHETVFAMTVHKSQGSEFERIVLVLPEEPSPILTRELLYTALTRARTGVIIRGTRNVLAAGIDARVQRASGLRDALWA